MLHIPPHLILFKPVNITQFKDSTEISMTIRLTGHAAPTQDVKHTEFRSRNPKVRYYKEDLDTNARIILKCTLNKLGGRVCFGHVAPWHL